jgi:hypothetical protein
MVLFYLFWFYGTWALSALSGEKKNGQTYINRKNTDERAGRKQL